MLVTKHIQILGISFIRTNDLLITFENSRCHARMLKSQTYILLPRQSKLDISGSMLVYGLWVQWVLQLVYFTKFLALEPHFTADF